MSQTVIPKGILFKAPEPTITLTKTQSLLALAALRLWQIWLGKAGNKNEQYRSAFFCPRWGDEVEFCMIGSASGCKWIKKIHWFSPPSVHAGAIDSNVPKCWSSAKVRVTPRTVLPEWVTPSTHRLWVNGGGYLLNSHCWLFKTVPRGNNKHYMTLCEITFSYGMLRGRGGVIRIGLFLWRCIKQRWPSRTIYGP